MGLDGVPELVGGRSGQRTDEPAMDLDADLVGRDAQIERLARRPTGLATAASAHGGSVAHGLVMTMTQWITAVAPRTRSPIWRPFGANPTSPASSSTGFAARQL